MALSAKTRKAVFERDNYHCRHCNNTKGLHPHHIIYASQGGPDTLDNLVTLCWECHRAVHDGFLEVVRSIGDANWDANGVIRFTRRNRKGIGGS